ncbi:hypothetical protein TNCV_4069171 [Trichonephila clavipes]|nr:hypothetical protein TNCV_4069171 [Trichonephila clavipes]
MMHNMTPVHFCAPVSDWLEMASPVTGSGFDASRRETTQMDLVVRQHAACTSMDASLHRGVFTSIFAQAPTSICTVGTWNICLYKYLHILLLMGPIRL